MSNVFFCADLHFGHKNVIKHCSRPFKDAEEMDRALIDNWNKTVSSKDEIYVLGDLSFHDTYNTIAILNKLNGHKYLIEGNHDKKHLKNPDFCNKFVWHKPLVEIKIDGQLIVLCHYAMLVWNKSHYGSWQLFGHSHHTLPDDPNSLRLDVGVDGHNYKPISFLEIKEKMSKKNFKPIDHHGAD